MLHLRLALGYFSEKQGHFEYLWILKKPCIALWFNTLNPKRRDILASNVSFALLGNTYLKTCDCDTRNEKCIYKALSFPQMC